MCQGSLNLVAKHWLIRSEAAAFGWSALEDDIIYSKRVLSPSVTGTELEQGVSECDNTPPAAWEKVVN